MSQNVKPRSSDSISCASKVMIKDSRNEAHIDDSNRCKKTLRIKTDHASSHSTMNFFCNRDRLELLCSNQLFISHFIIIVMNFTLKATRNLMQRYRQSKTVNWHLWFAKLFQVFFAKSSWVFYHRLSPRDIYKGNWNSSQMI